eukprot:CAMPEP_0183740666 /NCGR_PEP_ID=MMETSP0737-20130205/60211_1 /TAXON_ID=385413 /ORGANISM="Thalassiosira miniscula, Strain CCMP1093" /LENGTH=147 /DNA_ID=CAMNT_0025975793 /DNA_START=16 /DNA_END=459 /DNA_ORIENTATION=+
MARNYRMMPSSKVGTFHLGDERAWAHHAKHTMSFWKDVDPQELEHLVFCHLATGVPEDAHTLQNVINCGKLFQPRITKEGLVPNFVRLGYENVFFESTLLKNNPGFLEYSPKGFPLSNDPAARRSTHSMRQRWVDSYARQYEKLIAS